MNKKKIIIIGGGPAGLTAGYEALKENDLFPIIFEKEKILGGISCTINYKGNRMDIGGHRFFSKSDVIMDWWLNILPLHSNEASVMISYQNKNKELKTKHTKVVQDTENVMLLRNRKSRILYKRKFFDYPLKLNIKTLRKLGIRYSFQVIISYLLSRIKPRKENSLEDFFINRFGKKLYKTFFKSYTEKVWGEPCNQISAEWGRQRIKGLSIGKTIAHFFKKNKKDIAQKNTETSLIERFLYPKYGPGQMWETVAKKVEEQNGQIHKEHLVEKIIIENKQVKAVEVWDKSNNKKKIYACDYLVSSMPVQELVKKLTIPIPEELKNISKGLMYRDFITVGILLKKLKKGKLKDNWIYVQEPDVKLGRIQIFNNWSEAMVKDQKNVWLGLEYFCYENDTLWKKSKEDMIAFAIDELCKINFMDKNDFIDATVVKVPKTYPAYFGTYQDFPKLRTFIDTIDNLYLVGRNGMHKYNNQDHSMLTAIQTIKNIKDGKKDKSNVWDINTEQSYQESK